MAMANLNEMCFMPPSTVPSAYENCENGGPTVSFSDITVREGSEAGSESAMIPSTSTEETFRSCRNRKKLSYPICCPVCSVTVRPSELESHYKSELSRVDKPGVSMKRKSGKSSPSPSSSNEHVSENTSPEKRWETYRRVKENRLGRVKAKPRKRKPDDTVCPVCDVPISGDIEIHVDECLRRGNMSESNEDDEDIDVGGDEFREYEWAGQTRLRACSLLEGGYSAAGFGTSKAQNEDDDDDADLIVDGDDSDRYGPAQYSERDVAAVSAATGDGEQALRLAVIGADAPPFSLTEPEEPEAAENPTTPTSVTDLTVEALKQRIRELERRDQRKGHYRCLICMEKYRTPVISICCWHVHCELCWLKTLATKKLCPQCNMITSPSDLRRIYM